MLSSMIKFFMKTMQINKHIVIKKNIKKGNRKNKDIKYFYFKNYLKKLNIVNLKKRQNFV